MTTFSPQKGQILKKWPRSDCCQLYFRYIPIKTKRLHQDFSCYLTRHFCSVLFRALWGPCQEALAVNRWSEVLINSQTSLNKPYPVISHAIFGICVFQIGSVPDPHQRIKGAANFTTLHFFSSTYWSIRESSLSFDAKITFFQKKTL